MKKLNHLKTFESYNAINEEEIFKQAAAAVKKFATGKGSEEEMAKKKEEFESELKGAEEKYNANKDKFAKVDFAKLRKQAEDNAYMGSLDVRRSESDNLIYINYREGETGLQKVGGAAAANVRTKRA